MATDPPGPRPRHTEETEPVGGDLALLLQRIDRFEAERGTRPPRWLTTIGPTRAFVAVYRRAVVPIDRWLWRRDGGAHNRVRTSPGCC